MTSSKGKIIKRVLWEHSIMCLCIIAFGIFARVIFPTIGDEPVGIRWKYATAQFAYEISPLIILFGLKVLAALILDFFCFIEQEKTIILRSCSDDMHNFIFDRETYTLLLEDGKLWRTRIIIETLHILEPIWLDKRITNINCQVAHKYHIRMLRFSHLVVDIEEVTDNQALIEQLDNILCLIEQQQEELEICQDEIHAKQKKYAIQHQKYMDAEDEQKKDVFLSMMRHVAKEIDHLNEEKSRQEKILDTYQIQKKELEQQIASNK